MTNKPPKGAYSSNGKRTFLLATIFIYGLSAVFAADSQIQKSISKITKQLSTIPEEHQPLLVLDLQDLTGRTVQFGKYMSDQIQISLANSKKVEVLDRSSLAARFEERRLAEAGVLNEKTAVQFGEALGAKSVVYGTLAQFNKNIEITLKVIDIQKGITLSGFTERIRKTESIEKMINQITIKMEERDRELKDRLRNVEAREKQLYGRNKGLLYSDAKDYDEKTEWILNNECDAGNADACARLGYQRYMGGLFQFAGTEKARIILEEACFKGSQYGCYILGVLVENQRKEYTPQFKENYRNKLAVKLVDPPVEVTDENPQMTLIFKCLEGERLACYDFGIARYILSPNTEAKLDGIIKDKSEFDAAILGIWDQHCKGGKLEACTQWALESKNLREGKQEKYLDPKDPANQDIMGALKTLCDKNQGHACMVLGIVYGYAKEKAREFDYYRRGCAAQDAYSCSLVGDHYDRKNHRRKSLEYYLAACDLGKKDNCYGVVTQAEKMPNGKYKEELLKKACDNKYPEGCNKYAEYLIKTFEHERAKKVYRMMCEEKMDARGRENVGCYKYADLLLKEGNLDEAERLVRGECEDHDVIDSCLTFGDVLLAKGNKKRAHRIYQKFCEGGSDYSCEKMNAIKF